MSVEIWQIGCDLDAHLHHGGNLADVGMPCTPAEHWKLRVWIQSVPESVSKPRMARLARFSVLLAAWPPCGSEAQLRQCWAWAGAASVTVPRERNRHFCRSSSLPRQSNSR